MQVLDMEDLRVAKAFLAKVSAYGRQRALEHQAIGENASGTIQAAAASAFDLPSTMRTVKLQVSACYILAALVQFTELCLSYWAAIETSVGRLACGHRRLLFLR